MGRTSNRQVCLSFFVAISVSFITVSSKIPLCPSRYRRNEKFTWHLDALGPIELDSSKGGQRTATLLVYHTDLEEDEGGATIFRDLRDSNGERLKV